MSWKLPFFYWPVKIWETLRYNGTDNLETWADGL